jgi:transcriptional regulator with XRE-family HTH domain
MNWQAKRTMSAEEFVRAMERFKVSQAALGRYLGVSERTANRYAKGLTAVPIPSAMLLWGLLARREKLVIPRWISPLENKLD